MVTLDQIIDIDTMETLIGEGYITRRFHPEFPQLAIVGYSDKTQFDQMWNETTIALRGVIYNTKTLEVLARPFHKFFNWGDKTNVGDLDQSTPIMGAWDKADGSLGITYKRPDGKMAIATRGSFESDQAIHATRLLNSDPRYHGYLLHVDGATFLWEIIYPENRIVLDYGDRDDLMLLGWIDIRTGNYNPPVYNRLESSFLVQPMVGKTLGDVLALPNRNNAEGMVIWFNPQTAIKFKQEDYIALHRIVSSLNKKEVWRQLSAGTFDQFAEALPDEFHQWARVTHDELMTEFNYIMDAAHHTFGNLRYLAGDRKAFAIEVTKNYPMVSRYLFALLDGRDIEPLIWKQIEPIGANGELAHD